MLDDDSGPSLEDAAEQLMRESIMAGEDDDGDELIEELLLDKVLPAQRLSSTEDAEQAAQAEAGSWVGSEGAATGSVGSSVAEEALLDSTEALPDQAPAGNAVEAAEEEDSDEDDPEDSIDPAELAAAAAESAGWGRLIRQPRKRGKHVILDVCAPLHALPKGIAAATARAIDASEQGLRGGCAPGTGHGSKKKTKRRGMAAEAEELGKEGALVQQLVSAGDKRGWLGPAGWRLARQARWGDLWPGQYVGRALTAKVSVQELALTGAELRMPHASPPRP